MAYRPDPVPLAERCSPQLEERRPARCVTLDGLGVAASESPDELFALVEGLTRLAGVEPQAAELVHFRYFAGQTMSASADLLGLSLRSTHRLWAYAKAWLLQELERD